MSRKIVETHINRSIAKMGVPKLDCLQLHWWDYEDKRYMDALKHLSDMRSEGKIGMIKWHFYVFNYLDISRWKLSFASDICIWGT